MILSQAVLPAPMWVRIALHSYRNVVQNNSGVKEWVVMSRFVHKIMEDAPRADIDNFYRPKYFMCMHCGQVAKSQTILHTQFYCACARCVNDKYHPLSTVPPILEGRVPTPWSTISRDLLLYSGAVEEIDSYLANIILTGSNPFDIVIESIQDEFYERIY